MNRIKTVISLGFLVLLLFSCGNRQPEKAAESGKSAPAPAVTAVEPEHTEHLDETPPATEQDQPSVQQEQPEVIEKPVSEKAPDLRFSEPPPPEATTKTGSQSRAVAAAGLEPTTRIDIVRELIKAALANPLQKIISEPEAEAEPAGDITPPDLTSLIAQDAGDETGRRSLTLLAPDFVSFYKSSVKVSGYFTGFPDFNETIWEIAGTDRTGKISVNGDGSFEFSIDMRGLNRTLALRIKAEDSKGLSAQDLRILVNDGIGPDISIASPHNNSVYKADSIIEGRITGDVTGASIEAVGGSQNIPLELNGSGYFSIRVSDLFGAGQNPELPDNPVLKISASDSNSNNSSDYLSLLKEPNSGIIILTRPEDGDEFGNEVALKGEAPGIAEITWDIPGTGFSGVFNPGDGSFNYPLRLSGIGDSLLVRLKGKGREKTDIVTARLYSDRKTPEISVSEPSYGGYYTDSIPLRGRVGDQRTDVFETVKALKWGIPGTENLDNLIFFDEKGDFTIDLSLAGNTGVLPLEISVEDYNNNVGRKIIRLEDGKLPPEIKITLPSDDSEYGAFLDIAGLVTDPYEGSSYGGISGISYQLASLENFDLEPLTGSIDLTNDNRFGIQLQASEIEGDQQLTLTAVASNGNRAERTINLKKSSNDITSFTLTASDGSITANWRPLQVKSEYSLQVTDDGSAPSDGNSLIFREVSPPYTIDNVEDGMLYSVRLVADTDLGILSSGVKSVIPSNSSSFMLKAEGEFRQIKLDWRQLPGSDRYSIFRTDDTKKDFTLLASGIGGNGYTDRNISYGRDYYYYITPEGHDYAKSGYVRAAMMKAPDQRVIELNKLTSFNPVYISVVGNYVYTAAGGDGFRIVDKTNPDNLTITGSLTDINVESLVIRGDYAYLACGDAGLCILNISAPQLPFLTGRKATTNALDICLKDDFAYIADGEGGVKIMNITDARSPDRTDFIRDINSTSVLTYGNILLSNDKDSVRLFDVSEPASPVRITEYAYKNVVDMQIADDTAYFLSTDAGLIILDVSDIEAPELLSTTRLSDPRSLAVLDGFAYIADGKAGLKIINANNPKSPAAFDSLNTGTAIAVDVSGENVILAEENGLSAIQTFLQGVSFVINKLKLSLKNAGLALLKNIVLVPTADSGIELYNVNSPAEPLRIAGTTLPVTSDFPVVGRNRLYISEDGNRLAAYGLDSSGNVASWEPLYTIEFPDTIDFIRADALSEGREIVTVATLGGDLIFTEGGKIISSIRAIEARDCILSGGKAYLSDNRAGLLIYDIADLTDPLLLSTIEIEGSDHMVFQNDNLYIISRKGILIYNLADTEIPENSGIIKTNYAENIEIIGNNLYVAEGYKGLSVYDVGDPANPVLLTVCDTVYAADLVIRDDHAFVTDGTGLNTIQIFIPEWIK